MFTLFRNYVLQYFIKTKSFFLIIVYTFFIRGDSINELIKGKKLDDKIL